MFPFVGHSKLFVGALSMIVGMAAVSLAGAQELATPPDAEAAEAALDNSPRHQEFVELPLPGSDVKLKTFVVYPERSDKAPVIIVIHEIFGMTDWVNSVADHLASQGFIALAPDMISGTDPEVNAMQRVRGLSDEERVKRLNAVREYGMKLPASNGKTATIGFCWGGSTSFHYATQQPGLDAAVVYYGGSPDTELLSKINAPVLGHYGENDARVNTTIPPAEEEMKRLGKTFEYVIHDGAGHGFLRQQSGQDGSNARAAAASWPKTVAFLREHTETK